MDIQQMVDVTTVLANVATFLGIPFAIMVLLRERWLAREAAELDTYRTLQSEYIDVLRLSLENPDLALYDLESDSREMVDDDETRRMIGFEIWISMCESAFFLYQRGHRSEFRQRQWSGWEHYMRRWVEREDFCHAWRAHLGTEYDAEFMAFMDRLVAEAEARMREPPPPMGQVNQSKLAAS